MEKKEISNGVVHVVPVDLRKIITSDKMVLRVWEDLTPLARNEWICWVDNAKQIETRNRRIERTYRELKGGKRRPCCWAGCNHRSGNGKVKRVVK
ncbi:YdeI/OmpD-associated family protein [Candidatus Pacearchaeota archaeon]|nr:YdeI/OmpD-associated family protein [Candidatus Pacearchaeota archaeon]